MALCVNAHSAPSRLQSMLLSSMNAYVSPRKPTSFLRPTYARPAPAHSQPRIHSNTARRISQIFDPLETPLKIHMVALPSQTLQVDLPRLGLSFLLNEASTKIHCHQFRGMFIDACQRVGTLTGLDSKLVLRDSPGSNRTVLIPSGPPIWKRIAEHIRITIAYRSERIHPFQIDRQLRRLADDGTLQSKLALCCLHAITSHCLPDNLTDATGTERALDILESAAVRSFQSPSELNIDTLTNIAKLASIWNFCPQHERLM
ncbi:hypothetical protein K461DRAFT_280945 [Myriangium duriaei CBS 260.36]|uniref:Uncharacterized protein n=1 Tax=Myriangium duriaei CBS 260.36 TaxID=1168546 RepID=A0A9P4ME05_9PEZI|nr:hypothetical protein K461DRAFT_280945 [Myriangium duriaei CBS 260.36]